MTSLPGKSQHVQASPGRWWERDTFRHPGRTLPSPPRLHHVPMSPSSGHRRDSGATLEPRDNTLALTHGCGLPKPPMREGSGPGHRPLPWGWCRFQRPLPGKSFEAPGSRPGTPRFGRGSGRCTVALKPLPAELRDETNPGGHPAELHRHLRHPGPVTPVWGRLGKQEGLGAPASGSG